MSQQLDLVPPTRPGVVTPTTLPAVRTPAPPLITQQEATPVVTALAARAKADSTRRLYGSHWRSFERWCVEQTPPLPALPAASTTVAAYLAALAATPKQLVPGQARAAGRQTTTDFRAPETIDAHAAAIRWHHDEARVVPNPCDDPAVKAVKLGHRRVWAGRRRGQRGKDALSPTHLARLVDGQDTTTVKGLRNVALLLLGFAGAFRRSELSSRNELVFLAVEDLELRPEGLVVHVNVSKTDQTGEGRIVAIPYGRQPAYCPVRAVLAWLACLDAAGQLSGPLFRPVAGTVINAGPLDSAAVAAIVKAAARDADFLPAEVERLAGHSLRSGFVTAAVEAGVEAWAVAETTGHRDLNTLRKYIRAADPFKNVARVL